MSLDYIAAVQWIVGLLKGSTDLSALVGGKVYRNLIPQGIAMPAIKVNLITSKDRRFLTGQRALTVGTFQVVGVTQGDDLQQGAQIAAAIDAALENQINRNSALAAKVNREMIVDLSGAEEGERFNQLGGRYRVVFYQPLGAAGPSFMPILTTLDTNAGDLSETLPAASGNGQSYQYTNIGPGNATLSCAGSDTAADAQTITVSAFGSVTIASYAPGVWSIIAGIEQGASQGTDNGSYSLTQTEGAPTLRPD